jgi:hypothetical protein
LKLPILKNYFTLLFVLTYFFVSAQEAKGKLFDANNKPIAFANILLFDEKDSTLKATALSDTAGFFSLILPNTTDWFYISIQYFGEKLGKDYKLVRPKEDLILIHSAVC